jgi:hypothetical protein
MPPPEVWGPAVWTLFHTLAEKINVNAYPYVFPSLFNIIVKISKYLPCPECANDASIFLAKVKVSELKTKDSLKAMLCVFHNTVNAKKRKPIFHYSNIGIYGKYNLIKVINNFISHYQTKGNMKLLTESFQRQFVVNDFKNWFQSVIKAFCGPVSVPTPLSEANNEEEPVTSVKEEKEDVFEELVSNVEKPVLETVKNVEETVLETVKNVEEEVVSSLEETVLETVKNVEEEVVSSVEETVLETVKNVEEEVVSSLEEKEHIFEEFVSSVEEEKEHIFEEFVSSVEEEKEHIFEEFVSSVEEESLSNIKEPIDETQEEIALSNNEEPAIEDSVSEPIEELIISFSKSFSESSIEETNLETSNKNKKSKKNKK